MVFNDIAIFSSNDVYRCISTGQINSLPIIAIKFRETWSSRFEVLTAVGEGRDTRHGVDHGVVDSEKFTVAS